MIKARRVVRAVGAPDALDWYAAELCRSVYVIDSWKRLRDCTADDLRALVVARRQRAVGCVAGDFRCDELGAALTLAGARTVADLDPVAGCLALTREAAA